MSLKLIKSARPAFLVLGPITLALAVAVAQWKGVEASASLILMILLAAVAGHVSANAFNEYFDFRSGLDQQTRRTPFSGGSGLLPEQPELASHVLVLAWSSLALSSGLGLYLALAHQPALIPLGLLGIGLVYGYTRWLNRSAWLCYLAPGLGFGGVIYAGSSWLLSGAFHGIDLLIALVVGLLASNLLLLNQIPDIEADRLVGRRHLAIRVGARRAAMVHAIASALVFALLGYGLLSDRLPLTAMLALIPAALLPAVLVRTLGKPLLMPRLVQALGMNVAMTLLLPILLGVGLWWSAA
ncbi:MAG: prenyltransferase [Wenzhouxiangella sp.]|nr:prenyltransferase [Wenzhouxiangella sp.]MCH8477368.1 prenyltransferase [Wenzhouxiangella sp.]TVR91383.1 MAG: prenyltransferase [Wenzhouxiangellaceae bacterium]